MTDTTARLKTVRHDLTHNYDTLNPAFRAALLEEYKRLTGEEWGDDE